MTAWGMLALGFRLSVRGGRRNVASLLIAATGVAVGVTLLSIVLAAPSVFSARQQRLNARAIAVDPEHPERGTFGAVGVDDHIGHQPLRRVLVSAKHGAPSPPGVERLPAPGELVVSRSLLDLMSGPQQQSLDDRLPGTVIGTVADAGLTHRSELLAYVGAEPSEVGVLDAQGWGAPAHGSLVPRNLKLVLPVGALALLVPVCVFVAVATRLSSRQRDKRLAVLRLLGVPAGQTKLIAMAEAVVTAGAGLSMGLLLFVAVRPALANAGLAGYRWFPRDLSVPSFSLVAMIMVVPGLSSLAALFALRRVTVTPLGVVRDAARGATSLWRGVPLVAGFAAMASAARLPAHGVSTGIVVGVAFLLLVVGLPLAIPTLCRIVAAGLSLMPLRIGPMLAARRLRLDPSAPARAATGVVVGVFVAGCALSFLADFASSAADQERSLTRGLRATTVVADGIVTDQVVAAVAASPDVTSAVPIRVAYLRSPEQPDGAGLPAVVAECGLLRLVLVDDLPGCTATHVYVLGGAPEVAHATGLVVWTSASEDQRSERRLPSSSVTTAPSAAHAPGLTEAGVVAVVPPALAPIASDQIRADRMFLTLRRGASIDGVREAAASAGFRGTLRSGAQLVVSAESMPRAYQRVVFLGLMVCAALAAVSLAVTMIDHAIDRLPVFARLAAAGVPLRTLAASLATDTALAAIPGISVAVAAAVLTGSVLLRIGGRPVAVPTTQITLLGVAGAAAVLVAAALSMPLVRRARDVETLRTE